MKLWVILVVACAVSSVMQCHVATASKGFRWDERNCSTALHIPLAKDDGDDLNYEYEPTFLEHSLPKHSPSFSPGAELNSYKCPPWFRYIPQNRSCSFTHSLHGRVSYVPNTLQTVVLQCYCMTNDSLTHELAVGACPYTCLVGAGYYTLPCFANSTQNFTCDRYKRSGVSCGDCAPGFAPPVYSYSSHCVDCKHVNRAGNWIKYLTVAFVPLTLFTIFVIVFQIKATSPCLFSYIFIVQTMTLSVHMRLFQTLLEDKKIHSSEITKWGISLLSFWNLDFFRMHYAPFCLHPKISTLEANFMDFLVALYPLLLIAILTLLVELGIGRLRLCEFICSPVNRLCYHLGIEWNMRSNLISAFTTFILLSNEKILSATFDMLLPAYVYSMNRSAGKRLHVFSAGTVQYFGREHAPFALCSLLFVAVLVAGPLLVLLLYPLAFFRRVLRKLRLDTDALRSFVNHFQESYKNKREDGVEYRWFPLSYFILRFVLLLLYGVTMSSFFFPIVGVVLTVFVVFLAVCRPRKSEVHNAIDIFHIMCLLIFILGIMANITANSQTKRKEFLHTSILIITISTSVPLLYLFGLIAFFLLFRMGLIHKIKRKLQLNIHLPFQPQRNYDRIIDYGSFDSLPDRFIREDDYDSQIFVPKPTKYTSYFTETDSLIN